VASHSLLFSLRRRKSYLDGYYLTKTATKMRKLFLPLFASAALVACSSNETTAVKRSTDSTSTPTAARPNLPFTVAKTPDWQPGDPSHVALAMNTLKAYVDNDTTALQRYLADSVAFYADNYSFKGPKDSLIRFLTDSRNQTGNIDIRMQDYESVKSKGRGEEWVGMWYVETDNQKGGAKDSAMVMDDIRIVNGKVAVIDSKSRRLAKE
jgi:hypothetical protein